MNKKKKDKIKRIEALTHSPNENESEVAKNYLEKVKGKDLDKYSKPTKHSYENALEPSEQKALIKEWQDCGFPFCGKERVHANRPEEFVELWDRAVQEVHDCLGYLQDRMDEYRSRHLVE